MPQAPAQLQTGDITLSDRDALQLELDERTTIKVGTVMISIVQHFVAKASQVLMYVLMFALPISG